MIFYTLQGPKYKLEIHDDKIKLIRKAFWNIFSSKGKEIIWPIQELSQFHVTVPKLVYGKLEWCTFEGQKQVIRFSTNPAMVTKIEKYMQKVIIKNYQKQRPSKYIESAGIQAA